MPISDIISLTISLTTLPKDHLTEGFSLLEVSSEEKQNQGYFIQGWGIITKLFKFLVIETTQGMDIFKIFGHKH